MLLKLSDWNIVRNNFLDEEKAELNAAITGNTICPEGVTLDETKAPEVCRRLRAIIEAPSYQNAYGQKANWPNICHKHNSLNKLKDCGSGYTVYVCERCESESTKSRADLFSYHQETAREHDENP